MRRCYLLPCVAIIWLVFFGCITGSDAAGYSSVKPVFMDSLGIVFRLVPRGSFLMGSQPDEQGWQVWQEKPKKMIRIRQSFYLSQTEVTQRQWAKVMHTVPWQEHKDVVSGDNYPAVYISCEDAIAFCEKLSEMEGACYRLPKEDEWEYACRAETDTRFSFGDDKDDVLLVQHAWYSKNASGRGEGWPHEVARKKPNPWGFYDMHGNVFEWCMDWFEERDEEPDAYDETTYPKRSAGSIYRIMRGGSWASDAGLCRSGSRVWDTPDLRSGLVGFRVVRCIE